MIIAADGTHSPVRKLLNIQTETKDYQQSALVTSIHLNRDHRYMAYERFTPNGTIAMLPLQNQQVGCVWTGSTEKIIAFQQLANRDFLKQLQTIFGYRLGRFLQNGERVIQPLKKVFTKSTVRQGLVLIGNAAHTLHPIAAQGFNLGLADVALLTEIIKSALQQLKNPGNLAVLSEYERQRQPKIDWMMQFTDQLARIFSTDFFPLNCVRNSGLLALDFIPVLKNKITKRLMGVV